MKNTLPKLVAAALLSVSGLASASVLAPCSLTDIFFDVPGVSVSTCSGFVPGNVINSSPAATATVSAILATDFGFTGQSGAPIISINVSADPITHVTTYDFPQLLTGDVIVGLHFGNGGTTGNGTAFYEFNAGSGVDKFYTSLQASSNAGLYKIAPVPEPTTYAMLAAGLGLVGVIARRRKARA
ncbi:PEP-CTERM sorting domain-containing protein [Duganella sp. HSC-15S17]|uniref:PEP-CTERM sorting domain-containing protein n=1 Tax=Duganella violaceipulchra TaxID=2849652 RepID=A0AA41HD31_9BURK|nr:PEP-CTERM sorting domain-containing protein [Duganella violaceicalia]MBV6321578.1 PEP-CTERM sorting domain-containing protein [Duganella violaceicalia]MCP2008163.1 hypothetical protein [Duganella violaceicalia]